MSSYFIAKISIIFRAKFHTILYQASRSTQLEHTLLLALISFPLAFHWLLLNVPCERTFWFTEFENCLITAVSLIKVTFLIILFFFSSVSLTASPSQRVKLKTLSSLLSQAKHYVCFNLSWETNLINYLAKKETMAETKKLEFTQREAEIMAASFQALKTAPEVSLPFYSYYSSDVGLHDYF